MKQALLVAGYLLVTTALFARTGKRDWAQLGHYAETNETVKVPSNVVFTGNSIADGWWPVDSTFLIRSNFVDCGINGRTTSEMLVRFHQDVINLKSKAVVILARVNDTAHNNGVIALGNVSGSLVFMTELVKANHIKVIFCSVLLAYDFPWRPDTQLTDRVIQLNEWIKEYADKNGLTYVDYHPVMKDGRNGLPANPLKDDMYPTLEGYKIVEEIVLEAIHKTVK